MSGVLYDKREADALTASEKNESWRHEGELLKANLIIEHSGNTKDEISLYSSSNSEFSKNIPSSVWADSTESDP